MPPKPKIDEEIDRLYQLPLEEFTSARNALAKDAGPDAAARIRKLSKPPLAAWAVNLLYWKDRETYEDLIRAAETARATHKAILSGRKGDIRSANAEHDKAVDRASKAVLGILADSGHPVTDATRHAVLQTIRALPADDPPGRLTKTLQPGGFEMLTGVQLAPGAKTPKAKAAPAAPKAKAGATAAKQARQEAARRAREEKEEKLAAKRAREAKAAAERALRAAEQEARRGEFEVARAEREAERAQKRLAGLQRELDAARGKVAAAKQALEEL